VRSGIYSCGLYSERIILFRFLWNPGSAAAVPETSNNNALYLFLFFPRKILPSSLKLFISLVCKTRLKYRVLVHIVFVSEEIEARRFIAVHKPLSLYRYTFLYHTTMTVQFNHYLKSLEWSVVAERVGARPTNYYSYLITPYLIFYWTLIIARSTPMACKLLKKM